MAPLHKNLSEKLPQACRNTVLSAPDLAFQSFELRYGFGWAMSAADAVHALTGIMVRHSMIGDGGGQGGGGQGGGGAGGGGQLRFKDGSHADHRQTDSPAHHKPSGRLAFTGDRAAKKRGF